MKQLPKYAAILTSLIFLLDLPETLASRISVVEWRDLSDQDISPVAKFALSFDAPNWKHAESEHFIYHFINEELAETVYVNAEVYYRWVKNLFGIEKDPWKRKTQIFVFHDKIYWDSFVQRTGRGLHPEAFTTGWELFLLRHPYWLAPMQVTAHEIVHVVLFRFLEGPIPLCLNEGFAEFASIRALAMQVGRSEFDLRTIKLIPVDQWISLEVLLESVDYPLGKAEIFYRESELLVRYLILTYDSNKFYTLLQRVSRGETFKRCLEEIYGMDLAEFEEKFKAYAIKGKH